MIIVEGPDGSGKTTLIENLGHTRVHLKALRSGVGSEGAGNWGGTDPAPLAYAKKILNADKFTAFDRFFLSETIYGPMLRGASAITPEEVVLVRRVLTARGVPTILCLPSFETTLRNVSQNGRERPIYQTDKFLRRAYHGFASFSPPTEVQMIYDYERDLVPTIPPILPRAHRDVIGSPGARFLFVGDQSLSGLPFFSMSGGAGKFNRVIEKAGFKEHEIALTTMFDREGRPRNVHEVMPPHTEHVILLGRFVGQTFESRTGIPYSSFPHPDQWTGHERDYVHQFRSIRG